MLGDLQLPKTLNQLWHIVGVTTDHTSELNCFLRWNSKVLSVGHPPLAAATNRGLPPPGAAPVISAFSPPSPRRHIFYPLKAALVNRAQLCGENFGALGAVLWRLWMCNYTSRRRYFLKPKLCETLLAPQRWIWQILRWQTTAPASL